MEGKRAYLMANARHIPYLAELRDCYDELEQINVEHIAGLRRPLVLNTSITHTASKTMSAPGDDDPDPEDERSY